MEGRNIVEPDTLGGRIRPILLGFLGWSAIGLVFAIPGIRTSDHWDRPLLLSFAEWWAWGLIALLILQFDRRLPFTDLQIGRRLLAHVPGSLVLTSLCLYVQAALKALFGVGPVQAIVDPGVLLRSMDSGMFLWDQLLVDPGGLARKAVSGASPEERVTAGANGTIVHTSAAAIVAIADRSTFPFQRLERDLLGGGSGSSQRAQHDRASRQSASPDAGHERPTVGPVVRGAIVSGPLFGHSTDSFWRPAALRAGYRRRRSARSGAFDDDPTAGGEFHSAWLVAEGERRTSPCGGHAAGRAAYSNHSGR